MNYLNGARTDDTHNSASSGTANPRTTKPGSTPTATSGTQEPSGAVHDTWVQRDDVEGFTISLPDKTWQRQANGNQVDYTPDGGEHFVRIAIDDSPDFPTPFAHQQDLEQQLTKLVDYHRVQLQANTFRDCPGSCGTSPGPRWRSRRRSPASGGRSSRPTSAARVSSTRSTCPRPRRTGTRRVGSST